MWIADSRTHGLAPKIVYGWNALFFADTAGATVIKDCCWSCRAVNVSIGLVRDFDIVS